MYNDALLAMPNVNWVTMVCHLQKVVSQKKSLGNTAVDNFFGLTYQYEVNVDCTV